MLLDLTIGKNDESRKFLEKLRREDPRSFVQLIARVMPNEIAGEVSVSTNVDIGAIISGMSDDERRRFDAVIAMTHRVAGGPLPGVKYLAEESEP
jgi:hypothetical protein